MRGQVHERPLAQRTVSVGRYDLTCSSTRLRPAECAPKCTDRVHLHPPSRPQLDPRRFIAQRNALARSPPLTLSTEAAYPLAHGGTYAAVSCGVVMVGAPASSGGGWPRRRRRAAHPPAAGTTPGAGQRAARRAQATPGRAAGRPPPAPAPSGSGCDCSFWSASRT